MFKNSQIKSTLVFAAVALMMLFWGGSLLAHGWMAPKEAAQKQNPISLNRISIDKGKHIYARNCMFCHGENAKGVGSDVTGFQEKTPDLVQAINVHTEGDLFWKIQHGKASMPSFGNTLPENDIWNVINYIKSLKKAEK